MVQNKERYPMKTTATFIHQHFVIVCMIVVNENFNTVTKHNKECLNFKICYRCGWEDHKIFNWKKKIFFLIALISERKEEYNTGRIFVKIH